MSKKIGLIFYCIFLYITIGASWITLSWTMLGIEANQAAVAHLLIIGSLCTLLTSPILGLIVDRIGFRKTTVLGQIFSLTAALIPTLITSLGYKLISPFIYLMTFMFSISSILCLTAFDKTLKFLILPASLRKARLQISIFQQTSLMLGTALSGFFISKYNEFYVFNIIALFAVISITIFLYSTWKATSQLSMSEAKHETYWLSFASGIKYIMQNKTLIASCLCIALAYSSAQVINVSLPAFIKLELKRNSDLFGSCEALWAFGGIFAAGMLNLLASRFNLDWLPIIALACLGASMMLLSALTYPAIILFVLMVMGALFNIARTLADANVLAACSHEMIGRVRSNTMAVTSFVGIGIYLVPVVVDRLLPSTLYFFVGVAMGIISGVLMFAYRNNKQLTLVVSD
jgi:MFS family permease